MKALVAGTILRGNDGSGVGAACLAVDFPSVDLAPLHKFIGVYDDLFRKVAAILMLFESGLGSLEPLIVVGREIGADGAPSRPILFSIPSGRGARWICEVHKSRSWGILGGMRVRGAGQPCWNCNASEGPQTGLLAARVEP